MKNQYFGDVNDYRKYGFLRCLLDVTKLPLGVCWLLTPNDERNDGERRRYLGDRDRVQWHKYDPKLYDLLSRTRGMKRNERNVSLAEKWRILPEATYFEKFLEGELSSREIGRAHV